MEDKGLINLTEARPAGLYSFRKPAFWVDKPVNLFVLAEGRFHLHGTESTESRLGMTTCSWPLPRRKSALSSMWWNILCIITRIQPPGFSPVV
jgi:hypothetical protein